MHVHRNSTVHSSPGRVAGDSSVTGFDFSAVSLTRSEPKDRVARKTFLMALRRRYPRCVGTLKRFPTLFTAVL